MTKAEAKAKVQELLDEVDKVVHDLSLEVSEDERNGLVDAFNGMVDGMSCGDLFAILSDEETDSHEVEEV